MGPCSDESISVAAPDIVQEDSPMVITAEEEEHNMRCENNPKVNKFIVSQNFLS